jgi:hypothetical protein
VIWKQWKRGKVRFAELRKRGVGKDLAAQTAGSAHGPWRLAESARPSFCAAQCLLRLARDSEIDCRPIAQPAEPPDADPHVRWCALGFRNGAISPDDGRHLPRNGEGVMWRRWQRSGLATGCGGWEYRRIVRIEFNGRPARHPERPRDSRNPSRRSPLTARRDPCVRPSSEVGSPPRSPRRVGRAPSRSPD